LNDIAATNTCPDRIDRIGRKRSREESFECQFLNFTLQLLRALFGLSLQVVNLLAKVRFLFLVLSVLELMLFIVLVSRFGANLVLCSRIAGIDRDEARSARRDR